MRIAKTVLLAPITEKSGKKVGGVLFKCIYYY